MNISSTNFAVFQTKAKIKTEQNRKTEQKELLYLNSENITINACSFHTNGNSFKLLRQQYYIYL